MAPLCGHWLAAEGATWLVRCNASEGVHAYVTGRRCPNHTPAALAGRPEVVVDPERTLDALKAKAGIRYVYRRSDSSLIDQRAIASGRRRSNTAEYRQAQKAEHSRRMAEKARRRK